MAGHRAALHVLVAAMVVCRAAAMEPAQSAAVTEREAAISNLVARLEAEQVFTDRPEEAAAAVVALGQLRAEAAVPVLVEHLLFSPHTRLGSPLLADYPCAVALCRIGSPAAPVLLKRMAGDDRALWLGAQVLSYIDGPQFARARLRLSGETQLREDRTQRLRRAMGELDAVPAPSLGYGSTEAEPAPVHPAAIRREAAICELLATLKTEDVFTRDPDGAEEAVVALGHLRAEAAIGVLAANLLFEPHPPFGADGFRDFPCAVALARIGGAAAEALVAGMAADDDVLCLLYPGLHYIDGRELALERVRLAAEGEPDEDRRRRLSTAMRMLSTSSLPVLEPRKRR